MGRWWVVGAWGVVGGVAVRGVAWLLVMVAGAWVVVAVLAGVSKLAALVVRALLEAAWVGEVLLVVVVVVTV